MDGRPPSRRDIVSVLTTVFSGVLLFYSGVFAFIFAVPAQIVFARHGNERGVRIALWSIGAMVVIHVAQALWIDVEGVNVVRLLVFDSLMPVGVLAGLTVYNVVNARWQPRLLLGGLCVAIGALPTFVLLAEAQRGDGALYQQIEVLLNALGGVEATSEIVTLVVRTAYSTVGFGSIAVIAINWWIGTSFVARSRGYVVTFRRATVDDRTIWFVIGGLAVVVVSWLTHRSALSPLGWNVLLISAALYAVQGLGVCQHLLHRKGVGERGTRSVVTILFVLLLLPGINVIVLIGVPLLGMSEVWIDYKRRNDYEGHS